MADTPSQSNAIYHEQSPYVVLAGKIYAGVTGFMVILSILFCFIRGATVDGTFNLLGINLIISATVIGFLIWWYKTGDLAADKLWFIVLVASIILFQCITTDIYVFKDVKPAATPLRPVTATSMPATPNTISTASELGKVTPAPKSTDNNVILAKLPPERKYKKKL